MKLRLWRRRLTISAPRMMVRRHQPWQFRLIFLACAIGLGGALAIVLADTVRQFTQRHSGADSRNVKEVASTPPASVPLPTATAGAASAVVTPAENQLVIERATRQQISTQLAALEKENAKLKEDLAFFDSLLPTDTGVHEIAIRRLQVDLVAPNQLRYRMLLMQGGRGKAEFSGNLQLAVTTLQAGKSVVMLFPSSVVGDASQFKISFRHYQRLEGIVSLPEGSVPKAVQARVLVKGQMRTQSSVVL